MIRGGAGALPRKAATAVRVSYQPFRALLRAHGGLATVTFLQRVLKIQAALWAVSGLLLVTAPGVVVEGFLGLPPAADAALLRILGIAALVLAMLMVLVSQRALETWWWAWAFALLEVGITTICVLHALFAAGQDPTLPWWIAGAASAVVGALDLVGLAKAEQAKPVA